MSLIKGFIRSKECLETKNKHVCLEVASKEVTQLKTQVALVLGELASELCSVTLTSLEAFGQVQGPLAALSSPAEEQKL
jgi:hypothetical protein